MRGIAGRKYIKQWQNPNVSTEWGNLLKYILTESWLKFIKLGVCNFTKFGLLLKTQ